MSANLSDPFPHAYAITASDSADLVIPVNALWLGAFAGPATIAITTKSGEKLAINLGTPGVAAFFILPIQVSKVWNTGTANITTILGLYH